jgi:hypothetical protein
MDHQPGISTLSSSALKIQCGLITSSLGISHFMMCGNLCLEGVFRKCMSLLLSGIHEMMRVYCILVMVTQYHCFINKFVIGKQYRIQFTFSFTIWTLLAMYRSVTSLLWPFSTLLQLPTLSPIEIVSTVHHCRHLYHHLVWMCCICEIVYVWYGAGLVPIRGRVSQTKHFSFTVLPKLP